MSLRTKSLIWVGGSLLVVLGIFGVIEFDKIKSYLKLLFGPHRPVVISDGSLYIDSDNGWVTNYDHGKTVKPKVTTLTDVVYICDGHETPVPLVEGDPLSLVIKYVDPKNNNNLIDTITVTTDTKHTDLTFSASREFGHRDGDGMNRRRHPDEGTISTVTVDGVIQRPAACGTRSVGFDFQ